MKSYLSQLAAYAGGPAFSFLVHLTATAAVAWGVHAGFHLSVPVIPTSVTAFTALAFGKLALKNLGHSWHTGRLVAELEADGASIGKTLLSQFAAAAEGKAA